MSSGCWAAKLRTVDALSAFESVQSSVAQVSFTGLVVCSSPRALTLFASLGDEPTGHTIGKGRRLFSHPLSLSTGRHILQAKFNGVLPVKRCDAKPLLQPVRSEA